MLGGGGSWGNCVSHFISDILNLGEIKWKIKCIFKTPVEKGPSPPCEHLHLQE